MREDESLVVDRCTAFLNETAVAHGCRVAVAEQILQLGNSGCQNYLVFDDCTGEQIDFDFQVSSAVSSVPANSRATPEPVSVSDPVGRGPGRPKLGVVSREVTLLPRHWDWLNAQSGGASVTLRNLVDAARRSNHEADRMKQAQEAVYRFLSAMAGNRTGYEEAIRALFAGVKDQFESCIEDWPADIQDYARTLGVDAFGIGSATSS